MRWSRAARHLTGGNAYDIPTFEWGPASSPVIWNGLVILQCDTQADSFVMALDVTTGETVWKTPRQELPSWGSPTVPTPLAYGGLLYVLANNGVFDAYDLRSGDEIYRQRMPEIGSGFSASPLASDGKIYVSSEDGDVTVLRAGHTAISAR